MDTAHDSRSGSEGITHFDDAASKANAGSGASRVRRRNRMITSCLECRRRKLKCDRLHPCTNCSKGKRDCVFLAPSLDSATRLKLAELKERMGTLERSLESEATGTHAAEKEPTPDPKAPIVPVIAEADTLEPTGLVVMDAMYEDEADDIMVDLGIQIGKMRVTDRVGGLVRPRLVEELAAKVKTEMLDLPNNEVPVDDGEAEVARMLELANQGFSLPFLEPGPSFIAPRSDMLLGLSLQENTLLSLLPTKAAADKLLQQYWEACHPVARIVHRPTLEARYQLLWENIAQGIEPTPSVQAIIFATLFTAAVSMSSQDVLNIFGVDQRSLIESFQLGTESALSKAHFLRTTKTETLQAFVMYLIPMCRETISRAHSALVGAAIRLAECMGLHQDPLEYGYGPVETQVRRLIWYQLCWLDLRTGEVQGPRPTIRADQFTTKFPLNINDDDLALGAKEGSQEWTDMTFACIRFECQEIIREVFTDRMRLEKKLITLTGGLYKIETSRKAVYERYGPIFNKRNLTPLQRVASVTMSFLLHRLHIIIFHKFYNSWLARMPDRIVQLIINTGTQQLEDAVILETSPDLAPWRWYSRAYHSYHTALLLLVDVSTHPLRREADRIWRCLDYVYETEDSFLPQNITRRQIIDHRRRKTLQILRQFRDRMTVYRAVRKLKYSADVGEIKIGVIKPPSYDSTDSFPTSAESMANFNLRPATFLPMQSSVDQARARQTQSPPNLTQSPPNLFQTPTSLSDMSVMTESRNQSPGNTSDNLHYGQLTAQPNYETMPNIQGMQSTWVPASASTGPPINFGSNPYPEAQITTTAATSTSANMTPDNSQTASPPMSDMSMPEIDWTEWDKMFPPHLNDGNVNLSPQSLSGTLPYDMNSTMYTYTYAPFNSNIF